LFGYVSLSCYLISYSVDANNFIMNNLTSEQRFNY